MAKAVFNSMFSGMSGKFGGFIFRQIPGGDTIISIAPRKSTKTPSPAQLAHRQRFKEAVQYAHEILAEPEGLARYEERSRGPRKTPFAVAVSDYMTITIPEARL